MIIKRAHVMVINKQEKRDSLGKQQLRNVQSFRFRTKSSEVENKKLQKQRRNFNQKRILLAQIF